MKMYTIPETASFNCARELDMARDLLTLWLEDKITTLAKNQFSELSAIGFNANSGNVWLEDEEYNCLMENEDGELDLHINTPYEGHEGFLKDLLAEYVPDDMHTEDVEHLRNLLEQAELSVFDIPDAWKEENV
jgi:hypothetical protein